MTHLAYYNGKIGPLEEMTIPVNDRAVYFGDGVYEVVLVRNGYPFALHEHVDRFYNSLKFMRINFEMDKRKLEDTLLNCLSQSEPDPKFSEQMIYWQVSRGTATRLHPFPDSSVKPNLLITIRPTSRKDIRKKVRLITCEDTRFLHCNIKTLNLIPNILARQLAVENNCNEAIMHRDGIVTECPAYNAFILKGKTLRTAPLSNLILPGITRQQLIDRCYENEVPVLEKEFTLSELMDADEVILTGTGGLCLAAEQIDGKPIGGKSPALLNFLQDVCMAFYIKSTGG